MTQRLMRPWEKHPEFYAPCCHKKKELCVCPALDQTAPLQAQKPEATRRRATQFVILQHPQEPAQDLSTTQLIEAWCPQAHVVVGLSWKNLDHALSKIPPAKVAGESTAKSPTQPSRWLVLYLGSGAQGGKQKLSPDLYLLDRRGSIVGTAEEARWDGVLFLDGTWSQAKTLWWRNPWMLKLQRAMIQPERASAYGKWRKEPRRECLSTLETVAFVMESLEKTQGIHHTMPLRLRTGFDLFLKQYAQQRNVPRGPSRDQKPDSRAI